MNRFLWLGLAVVVVVLVWTGVWFAAAAVVTNEVKALESADGVTTPRVTCAEFSVGGYPFGIDVRCGGATIVSMDTTVSAGAIKATAQLYNPFHVLGYATSPIEVRDAFTGLSRRLDFSDLEFSARMNWMRIARVSLIGSGLTLNDTVLEDRLIATAEHVEAHLGDVASEYDAAQHLVTLAQYATVTGLDVPGFEIESGTGTFDGKVSGLGDDVRLYGEPDAMRRWQEAGGVFTLKEFSGEDATSSFKSRGTLSLDSAGRPDGQFRIESKGVVEKIGRLSPGVLPAWIVGAPAADGSYTQVINIQAGVVFAGLVPVAAMGPAY